eukprot:gb/GFBE01058749.1/.p1 GENE.gb/GFBE01058749.1/~~gb/GFBE01058749.1/.p1  ORF type:complete len:1165 (+),score=241.74 gb/GFBE01058749.1/:1-3495(+)
MEPQPTPRGGEERRRRPTAEGSRSSVASRGHGVRVLARVRPLVANEEEPEMPCLRVMSTTQLEVFLEPRALLTDSVARNRRRTIGAMPNNGFCRSSGALADSWTSLGSSGQQGRGLESRAFSFDKVFDASVSDDQVFDELQDEIKAALEGEAVCILAYGATGSGKTHTVTNLAERTAKELDRQAESLELEGLRLELQVQIVEIYNEQFRDLLVQDTSQHEPPRLKMSTPTSSASLQGAEHRKITRDGTGGIMKSLQAALRFGQAQRATSSTSVHGRSSRSHLVMMLYLVTLNPATGCQQQLGRLSLVDLAGSERIKSSEATGDRLKEAQHINRSLSALADVVVAKEKGVAHVPYRNSKLTHLLQDALGGQPSSRTVIIVALPPTRTALGETLHSLQLSSRLNSISIQRASRGSSIFLQLPGGAGYTEDEALRLEADRLRIENARMRSRLEQLEQLEERERAIQVREREVEALRHQLETRLILQAEELKAVEKVRNCQEVSVRMISGSPPSPVPEADSSVETNSDQEKSPDCQVWMSSPDDASSPASNGQQPQPEPEAQPETNSADESEEELCAAQPEVLPQAEPHESPADEVGEDAPVAKEIETLRCATDQESSKLDDADVSVAGTSELDNPPEASTLMGSIGSLLGSIGSWKWADPKEQSQQGTVVRLPSVPSPARRRRSSAPTTPEPLTSASFQEDEQGSELPLASSIEHQVEQDEDDTVLQSLDKKIEEVMEAKPEEASPPVSSFIAALDAEDELALASPPSEGQDAVLEAPKAEISDATSQSHLTGDEAFIAGTSASDLNGALEEEVIITSRSVIVPVACGSKARACLRARSANARSPREYIVEEISPQRVRELTRSAIPWTGSDPLEDPVFLDMEFAGARGETPFVMLRRPGDEDCNSPGRVSRISESSAEEDIKDRMMQDLRIKQQLQAAHSQARRPQMSSYVRGAGQLSNGVTGAASQQVSSPTPCYSHPGPAVQRTPHPGSPGSSSNQTGSRITAGGSWSSYRVPPMPKLGSPVGSNSGSRPSPARTAPSVAAAAAAAAATGHLGTPRGTRAAETTLSSGNKAAARSLSSSPRGPFVSALSSQVGTRRQVSPPGSTASPRGFASGYPGNSAIRATTPRVATSPGSGSILRTPQRNQPFTSHSLVSSARLAAGRQYA